jgi:hypothetical protein
MHDQDFAAARRPPPIRACNAATVAPKTGSNAVRAWYVEVPRRTMKRQNGTSMISGLRVPKRRARPATNNAASILA